MYKCVFICVCEVEHISVLDWVGLGWVGLGWVLLGCVVLCCVVLCWVEINVTGSKRLDCHLIQRIHDTISHRKNIIH